MASSRTMKIHETNREVRQIITSGGRAAQSLVNDFASGLFGFSALFILANTEFLCSRLVCYIMLMKLTCYCASILVLN
jgi:hypothetical protein